MRKVWSETIAAGRIFTTFLLWFLILVLVFTTIGAAQGDQLNALKNIVSFGDPRTIVPLAFSFLFGIGLKFLTRSSPRIFNVACWICSFGRDGYLVFYALLFALVLGTWETALFGVLGLSVVILTVSVTVMSLLQALEQCVSDASTRIIFGLGFLLAAAPLPAVPL